MCACKTVMAMYSLLMYTTVTLNEIKKQRCCCALQSHIQLAGHTLPDVEKLQLVQSRNQHTGCNTCARLKPTTTQSAVYRVCTEMSRSKRRFISQAKNHNTGR